MAQLVANEGATLKIGNAEIKIDMFDVDFMAAYENFCKALADLKNEDYYNDCKSDTEKLIVSMDLYDDEMDKLFGEGTAEAMFGESHSLRPRINAIQTIQDECLKQKDETDQFNQMANERYSPNRYQRRHAK
jgi:hypothetical protein